MTLDCHVILTLRSLQQILILIGFLDQFFPYLNSQPVQGDDLGCPFNHHQRKQALACALV